VAWVWIGVIVVIFGTGLLWSKRCSGSVADPRLVAVRQRIQTDDACGGCQVKRKFQLLVVCATVVVLMGADNHSARYENLGSKIMCSCGCGRCAEVQSRGLSQFCKDAQALEAQVDETAIGHR